MQRLVALSVILIAAGCASSSGRSLEGSGDGTAGEVELVVINRSTDAVTVFALWQGATRVRLGELRGGATRTFTTPYRGREFWLSVDVLSSTSSGRGDQPNSMVPVLPGDRLEWVVQSTYPLELFWRRLEGG